LIADALALPVYLKPPTPLRRRVTIVALALVVGTAIPAVAAQQALPGEALYGWKKGSERFLVLFDRDIRARHRLNELESLLSSGRDLDGALTAAEVELADVEDEALLARWSILLTDLEQSTAGEEGEAEDQGSGGGTGVAPADDDETDDREEAAEEEEEADDDEVEDESNDEKEESDDGEESEDDEPDHSDEVDDEKDGS
jgi:hypothetical protein